MVEGLHNSTQAPANPGWRWPAVLACVLLAGMAIGLMRLVLGLATVSRYRRFSCPLDDPGLTDLLAIVQAELGCTRSVAIHESAAVDSPAVVGWLRPLVLLPENWRNWTQDERRAVLAHEVAHIAQNDYASWVLAQLSLIANFYNPLVHWLVGRLRIEQELAADGCGARLAGGRETYLTILAGMALRLDNRQASWAARPFLPARGTFSEEDRNASRCEISGSATAGVDEPCARGFRLVCCSLARCRVAGSACRGVVRFRWGRQHGPTRRGKIGVHARFHSTGRYSGRSSSGAGYFAFDGRRRPPGADR